MVQHQDERKVKCGVVQLEHLDVGGGGGLEGDTTPGWTKGEVWGGTTLAFGCGGLEGGTTPG